MLITSNNNKKMIKKVAVIIVMLVFVMTLFNQRAYAIKKSLTLNENKIEISKGETYILIASAVGLKKKVTWSSSNKKVATVKRGVIVGKRKGKTTITAKCGKLKAKCIVTVRKESGIYHTEKDSVRYYDDYQRYQRFSLIISIVGNKLIVEGELKRTVNWKTNNSKMEQVKGKKHIFILSPNTRFWNGDLTVSKAVFLEKAKEFRGSDTVGLLLDMENGKVVDVGLV